MKNFLGCKFISCFSWQQICSKLPFDFKFMKKQRDKFRILESYIPFEDRSEITELKIDTSLSIIIYPIFLRSFGFRVPRLHQTLHFLKMLEVNVSLLNGGLFPCTSLLPGALIVVSSSNKVQAKIHYSDS